MSRNKNLSVSLRSAFILILLLVPAVARAVPALPVDYTISLREAGRHDRTETHPAHLRSSYEKRCDYIAMRVAYRCRAYPDAEQ